MNELSKPKSKAIIKAIADIEKVKIIQSTMGEELKTVYDIIEETNIPLVTCYRKVKSLVKSKILIQKGFKYLSDGGKAKTYKCMSDRLNLSFASNKMTVSINEERK